MNLLVPRDELADAFLDSHPRLEAEHARGVGQVGIRQSDVARLIGMALDVRFPTERLGDEGDQPVETNAITTTEVDRLDGTGCRPAGPLQRGQDAVQAVGK